MYTYFRHLHKEIGKYNLQLLYIEIQYSCISNHHQKTKINFTSRLVWWFRHGSIPKKKSIYFTKMNNYFLFSLIFQMCKQRRIFKTLNIIIVFTWLWRRCNHRWKIRCRWSHLSIILRIIWSENVWLLWHHGIRTWDHRGWLHIRSWRLIGCWNLIWNMSSIAEINKLN